MALVSMATRNEITVKNQKLYLKGNRAVKGEILDALVISTGLHRKSLIRILHKSLPQSKKRRRRRETRGRKHLYSDEACKTLTMLWSLLDFACGKRIKEGLADLCDAMIRAGHLDPEAATEVCLMSASTIDRILAKERRKYALKMKGRSTTKPGTLLKSQIPIRLGTQWDENMPGFVEIDLVAHCGASAHGEYVNTLDITDIASGWTVPVAVRNKAQKHVHAGLVSAEKKMPFTYRGIDSDNGSEFINDHLLRYCESSGIVFTRSRLYKKNDGCHIEQKNWDVVRKKIGYSRFEGQEAVDAINEYYDLLCVMQNFFMPSTKLVEKTRNGSKVTKKYDKALSPYRRMLAHKSTSEKTKKRLTEIFESLDPLAIRRAMIVKLKKVEELALPYNTYKGKGAGA